MSLQSQFFLTDPEILLVAWYVIPAVLITKEPDLHTAFISALIPIWLAFTPVTGTQENKVNNKQIFQQSEHLLHFNDKKGICFRM